MRQGPGTNFPDLFSDPRPYSLQFSPLFLKDRALQDPILRPPSPREMVYTTVSALPPPDPCYTLTFLPRSSFL